MPPDRGGRLGRREKGFTLFEMVVVICLIVILYMVAEQRLNELPAAAERASFHAVLAQLKTGINLRMFAAISSGDYRGAREMEGGNPMDLLLELPGNYGGEVVRVDSESLARGHWYFDRSRGELVYLVGAASVEDVKVTVAGTPVSLGEIRLKLVNVHEGQNSAMLAGEAGGSEGQWEGILLLPVRPFEWERRAEQPVNI